MSNYDESIYDDFLREANKDNRVGNHEFLVTDVQHDQWESGDPRIKIVGNLVTANNSRADMTISPPPAPEILKAEGPSWGTNKKKAIANNISIYRSLAKLYDKTPETLRAGDTFKVKTVLTKKDPVTNKGGFVRIVSILPKDAPVGASAQGQSTASGEAPPF